MKTKHYLLGLLLLVLVAALVRFRDTVHQPDTRRTENATAGPLGRPVKATARAAKRALNQRQAPPVAALKERLETGSLVADLLARLEKCDEAQRKDEIRKFVAGCEVDELEDMLGDESSTATIPEDLAQSMLRRLARDDVEWMGDFLQAMPAGTLRGELLGTTMVEWGNTNMPAAVEWAKSLKDTAMRETALVHLSYRWFEENPEEALAYAALNPAKHRQLLTTLVGQWSRQQPGAAAAWAAEFSSDPTMAGVGASAVAAWAQKDDLAAAEFVLRLPDGQLRHEAAISVMSALAQRDPGTGALWAEVFPSGPKRDYAIENLVYSWAVSDPGSALTWANRLPGSERDIAIFAGAGGLAESNPALAARWVMSIQDEGRRLQQSERVAANWLKTDRWSAEAWIRSSTLPDQTKTRLLASAGSGS